jgi:formiminotetrahydrofolate cyclodeaminase
MLTKMSVTELLDALSAPTPTPGGGSAAALAGALGASLLAMVAGLPKTRTGAPAERAALDEARPRLLALQATLLDLVDRDSAAYDLVVAAYKRPKTTDQEKAARAIAVGDALEAATRVPLETVRACADVIDLARVIAVNGNPSAKSDVGVAGVLANAGWSGGAMNVEVNLESVKDPDFATGVRLELDALRARMARGLKALADVKQ